MLLRNRSFKREQPSREAKSIYVFCEGAKREYDYFNYFKEIDSRVNIEVYPLNPSEDNSPRGLLAIAKKCVISNKKNPRPKYSFLDNDEVWIVLDRDRDKKDSRKPQIEEARLFCEKKKGWGIAQSNPCFEVWLYYHHSDKKPELKNSEKCSAWKKLVNASIPGGFNSRKHSLHIEQAIQNAEKNFYAVEGIPKVGSTEVFKLSKSIFSLVSEKIKDLLLEDRR